VSWRDKPCKLWGGKLGSHGYGITRFNGESVTAHRLAFFLDYGHWPTPLCCHRCDVRACVEPAHLFEGTRTDNNRDMCAKGRHWSATQECKTKGERHPMAKLSKQNVLDIRANAALCRVSQAALARRFWVSPTTVCSILKGKTWKQI
jgi:HNH endonuclease